MHRFIVTVAALLMRGIVLAVTAALPFPSVLGVRPLASSRRNNTATVRYMSFFIKDDIVQITQLQGVPLIEMPKGLRDWAERFMKAAMEFARAENFRAVWVLHAEAVYSYHHPYLRSHLVPEVREREVKRIRANIELHHNVTASGLGFAFEDIWFKWQNHGNARV